VVNSKMESQKPGTPSDCCSFSSVDSTIFRLDQIHTFSGVYS